MPGPFGSGSGPNYTARGIAAMLGLVAALTTGYFFSVGGGSTGGLLFTEGTAAGTPASGEQVVYAKAGGLYVKNSSGTESQLDASGISGLTAARIPVAASATTIANGSFTDDSAGTFGLPAAGAGANGWTMEFDTPAGGAASSHAGYNSGSFGVEIGAPSAGNGTNMAGGTAGSFYVLGNTGAVATGSGTSGIGSDMSLIAGTGGASSGASGTGGRGGLVDLALGAGGAANGGVAGADGSFRVLKADLSTVLFKVDYAGAITATGPETITGDTDAVQLLVKGHSTQTNNILEVQASDASKKFTVAGDGTIGLPYIFRVSGTTTAATANSDASFLFYGGVGGGQGGIFMARQVILSWRDAAAVGTGSEGGCISFAAQNVLRTTDYSGTTPTWIQQTPARVRRAATQTVTDTTTLAADDTLSITVYSGRKYTGKLCYFFTTTVNSSGAKIDLAGGTASFTSFEGCGKIYSTSANTFLSAVRMSAANTAVGFTATGTTAYVEVDFSFVCNAGGTFKPNFAQNAETGAAESVVAGTNSFMWLEDMP